MLPTTQKCGPLKQQGANIFLSWNIQTRRSAWCFYSWDGCFLLIWVHEICILWKQYYIKILSSCFTCYLLKSKLFSLGFVFWDCHKSTSYTNGHRTWRNSGGETCLLLQYISSCIYYYRNNIFSPQQISWTERNGEASSQNNLLSSISRKHTSLLRTVNCATL